jgi:uncharacterized delta-60 repeat protein
MKPHDGRRASAAGVQTTWVAADQAGMRSCLRTLACASLICLGTAPAARAAATLDPGFGIDGIATTNFGGVDYGNGVVVQADGKVVAAGYRTSSGSTWYDFIGERLEPDGTALDNDFGPLGGGFVTPISDGQANDYGEEAALAPGGKIVVAGYTIPEGGHTGSLAVARYESDGDLDPTFDTDGKAIHSLTPEGEFEQYYAATVQADGKILVAGSVRFDSAGPIELAVVRLNVNGSLDTSFSDDGVARVLVGTQSQGTHIRLTSGGQIVVGGFAVSGGAQVPLIARLTSTGALDTSFDGDGRRVLPASLDGIAVGIVGGLDVTADGRTLVGLWSNSVASHDWGVARLTPAGALDNSFGGGDGVVTSAVTASSGGVVMRGLELDSHGRVVVGGSAASNQPAVARYTAAGAPDTGFAPSGLLVVTDGDALLWADGFTVDANDRPLLSGVDTSDMVVARFTAGDPPPPPPPPPVDGDANHPGEDQRGPLEPDLPAPDTKRPVVRLVVKRDIVLGSKLSIPVRVDEAAQLTATLEVSAGDVGRASRIRTRRRRPVAIGRGRVSLPAAGRGTLRIRLTAKGRRAVSERRRGLAATLRVRATDRAGNVSRLKRSVRLRKR